MTSLSGLFVVRYDEVTDSRGGFFRTYCRESFASAGLSFEPTQGSESHNRLAGTVRGLHFQAAPHGEQKLVRCTKGEIFDVAVDIRPSSENFGGWFGMSLSESDKTALYIPEGFAHGFVALKPDSVVSYLITPDYVAGAAAGIRWNDPDIGIEWPISKPEMISDRDCNLPLLAELRL